MNHQIVTSGSFYHSLFGGVGFYSERIVRHSKHRYIDRAHESKRAQLTFKNGKLFQDHNLCHSHLLYHQAPQFHKYCSSATLHLHLTQTQM